MGRSDMFEKCKDVENEDKRKFLQRSRAFYERMLPPFLRTYFEANYIEFLATVARFHIQEHLVPKAQLIKSVENPWLINSAKKVGHVMEDRHGKRIHLAAQECRLDQTPPSERVADLQYRYL